MSNQIEYITCRQCGKTEPLTKKFKCSSCGTKNWGYKMKKSKGFLWEIIGMILLIAGIGVYLRVKEYNNAHWTRSEVESSFSQNLALIYHEFVFEVDFDGDDEPAYFVRNADGGFTQWQKGMQPNSVMACGLIYSKEGECVTTRKVAYPWLSDWDDINLKREIHIFREATGIRSGGHIKLFTVKLGYYPLGSKYEDPNAFVECRASGDWESGVSSLVVKGHYEAPEKMKTFYHPSYTPLIKNGDKIFIAGYPLRILPGDNLNSLVTESKVDSMKNGFFYSHLNALYTLEGAPVFNEKGNVIGFCSIDDNGNIKSAIARFDRPKTND